MTKPQKVLALILCVVMCLSMLPTWALAEEGQNSESEAVLLEAETAEEGANTVPESETETEESAAEVATDLEQEALPEVQAEEPSEAVFAEEQEEPESEETGEEIFPQENSDAGSTVEQTQTVMTEAPDNTVSDIGEAPKAQESQTVGQEGTEQEDYLTVIFRTTPEDAEVTLYTKGENGEKTVIDPEEDGSYQLLPGEYYYNTNYEGYISNEECIAFDTVSKEGTIEVKVELPPLDTELNDLGNEIGQHNIKTDPDDEVAVLQASGWNSWTTTGDLAQDLVNCAVAQNLKNANELGLTGSWCAKFIIACAEKTGNSGGAIPASSWSKKYTNSKGNQYGITYAWGLCQAIVKDFGGRKLNSGEALLKGDIVYSTSLDHVGIIVDNTNCVCGNNDILKNGTPQNDYRVRVFKTANLGNYEVYRPAYNEVPQPVTVTITSKANSTHSTDITDTVANISRYVYISGASFSNATDFGLELFDSSGSTKLAAKSDGKPIVSSGGYVDAWYKIGKGQEINYTLTPDTTYKYRFYTKIGGTTHCSDFRSFTTTGFTVSYNANGGSGAPAAQKCATGANVTLSGTKPTRGNSSATGFTVTLNANGGTVSPASLTAARTTSYTFKNWNSAANGSGTAYNAGASYTGKASITLFAQWNISTTTSAVTLPVPTKAGHTFNGWATSSNAASGVKGSYTPTGNVTLYATWTPEKYTVTYHANGGTGAPAAQTKTYGTALTISSTKPTRANSTGTGFTVLLNANGGTGAPSSLVAGQTVTYSFKNWNTASDGSKTSYNPGSSYTTNAAAVLYAQWTSKTTTEAVELPTPSREGYSFGGWATSSSATSGSFGKYTPSGNVTLYAVWTRNQSTVRFTDVSDPTLYFYNPVYWAVDHGITTGRSDTTFDPYGYCTRGHIVLFLWRAFGKQEPTVSNPFSDVSPDDSFYKAVLWAYENGITTGQTATTFGPWNFCTRGQIVTFLWRAMGQAEPGISNPFTDVNPGDGFYRAVLWAVENGITTGRTPTTFDPWATCTRGQAVTFLYRAMHG